ncbi:substrate-binding periplasmic protein [Rheinheimera fenheensis]|uniref:substrate-binding periplasmic protein n=1 Tax=Rheinheimera fenheensis TaxID=3152295 RepID=UPI003261A71F
MVKWVRLLWLPLVVLLSAPQAHAAPLNVLVGQNKPPYIRLETVSGYELELLREVVRRMGHEAVFVFVPNSRIRGLLESGNGDIATLQPNEPDEPGLFFSQPYIRYQNIAVSRRRDELTLQHPADLAGKSVIAFQGATKVLGPDYRDSIAQNPAYQETVDQRAQVDLLLFGRTQVVVLDRNIFTYHLQSATEPVEVSIHPLFGSTLYRAAFRDPVLQRSFDKALLSVLLDNWYQQLQLTYFLQVNQQLPNRFYCPEQAAAPANSP